MKCLSVGADNILPNVKYSSTNNTLPNNGGTLPGGYYNLIELAKNTPGSVGGFSRMWFEPNDMTLQRFVDPTSGQATIQFQSSTVQLLTEAYLQELAAESLAVMCLAAGLGLMVNARLKRKLMNAVVCRELTPLAGTFKSLRINSNIL